LYTNATFTILPPGEPPVLPVRPAAVGGPHRHIRQCGSGAVRGRASGMPHHSDGGGPHVAETASDRRAGEIINFKNVDDCTEYVFSGILKINL